MQTRFDIFFPHWHLLLHILHEIMQIYKETKISDYIMSIYICNYYVEVTSRSLWVCPYLGPSSANLSRCSSIIGGRLLNRQAIKGQRRWCVMGYSMH